LSIRLEDDDRRHQAVRGADDATTAPPPVEQVLRGLRVLIAEDVAVNQTLFRTILSKLGAIVTVVANGREAVDTVTRAMATPEEFRPRIDGHADARGRRVRSDRAAPTRRRDHADHRVNRPRPRQTDREKCMAAGCTDFVPKPIDRATLITTIRAHVKAVGIG
jgi:CheY-like chemotaxis protein